MNSNKLRTIVAAAVFVVLSAGLIAGVSMGTLSGCGPRVLRVDLPRAAARPRARVLPLAQEAHGA